MAKPGQSSFRRILLSRILLLSIPVLLAGEFVAYQKARSSLLKTGQQNLTESAVRRGDNIRDLVEVLRSNLMTASAAVSSQLDRPQQAQEFVKRMAGWMPAGVQCIQLVDLRTGSLEASTCGDQAIVQGSQEQWPLLRSDNPDLISTVRILPASQTVLAGDPSQQLKLVLSTPVYDARNQLRYELNLQAALRRQEAKQTDLLLGYTIVLDQDGTILAHPQTERIGQNIRQQADVPQLHYLADGAIAGKQDFLSFKQDGTEWLVGYNAIQIPVSATSSQQWLILSVSPLSKALHGLEEIKQVLVVLTLGLVGANLLATMYITRDLARPIEQLSGYALHLYDRQLSERSPKDFRVKELHQLATALDLMVERLEERAEELQAAWQQAQAANQLKSEFLATTSHELRTPLNAIIGCVRLVKDGCCDSPEEELEFLQQADDAAIHLLKIINDLLDIAKIEAGKVELNLQPVLIQDLCQQCLSMIQPGAEKKRLTLSLDVDRHLNHVPLDERRVRQMVINLLSNAVKFTPEGGQVKLSSRIRYGQQLEQDVRPDHSPINPNTPYLCIEVIDSGIGIPQERWHLLFRPFQQVDSSLTRKHEGTGLGLALTKRLAELHGGTVSFQSTVNKGSIFRIWLPAQDFQASAQVDNAVGLEKNQEV